MATYNLIIQRIAKTDNNIFSLDYTNDGIDLTFT